ncbi:fibronectin type III domain-containing protein [Deinococcus misasensis]|uniref:fibronectin type III domain-containing protein n=1 Tax=Deinococcus misasensis TaxID=392413 RepID=UPI0005587003|nr:fibronectin type III domain-containing protein [Deinococcus misasensis]
MMDRRWLLLGLLALAACSPQTPPPTGTKIKAGEGGTVLADNPQDGQLDIDKGKLLEDAIISVGLTTTPNPPTGVTGNFNALAVRVSGIQGRPIPDPLETGISCPSGLRLRISFPANTPRANELRIYNTDNGWKQLVPYQVNLQENHVVGCMASLKAGTSVYTLGIPESSFNMSGGTSENFAAQGQEVFPKSLTAFRMKYQGTLPPDPSMTYKVTLTGPEGWNNNQPYQRALSPDTSAFEAFSVDAAPVSGTYTYSYSDGVKTFSGTFNINAQSTLPRPSGLQVTRKPQTSNTFSVSWTAPEGIPLFLQETTVFQLGENPALLASDVGGSPAELTLPNFDPQKTYAFCVLAYGQNPQTTDFGVQVNESRSCTTSITLE